MLNKNSRILDPRITNIAVDANALDRKGTPRDSLVDRFNALASAGKLRVVIAGGVRNEVLHPRTPANVKASVLPKIFNLRAGLNSSQQETRRNVAVLMQGNARPDAHAADASHLSEADETGCAYFVTEDKRILAKRDELHRELKHARIVTLKEFFVVFDRFEAERPR